MTQEPFEGVIGRTVEESTPWWPPHARPPEGAPNVVVIVLDDVGFAHLGCYGSDIQTPNIDRLAAGGLRYANFHTTPLCSPTRACLLTGRNHHAVGMGSLANWNLGFPGSRGCVTHSAATLGEMLQAAGYNTFATGKWHLTPGDQQTPAGPYDQWPLQRGFERYYGYLDAATSHWRPELTSDNHRVETPDRPDYHLTEDIVDRAIEFVRDQVAVAPDKPFFLYVALGAAHEPHHAPAAFIDKYDGVFDKGWDVCREQWLARQKQMGLVPEDTVLPPRNPGVKAWEELGADERRLFVRLQQAFAGMLDHADHHIGRLIEHLERIGQRENTLVVLLSDNGASQEGSLVGTINTMIYHNDLEDELERNLAGYDDIGTPRGYNNYPLGWAMAGNTPARWYKQNTHGGGIRDPLIVNWPAGVAGRGEIRTQFHHVTDVLPTILEAVGAEAPEVHRGVPQMPVHGTSMAYTFADADARTRKQAQHFEMLGHRGVWVDGWKAVVRHERGADFETEQWELYDLEHDFSETNDLAQERPEKLRELVDRWWEAAAEHDVLPLDDRVNERWLAPPGPGSVKARSRYVFFPGMPHLGPEAAPDTKNVSHTIEAAVGALDAGAEGVLLANGGVCGGYCLFVADGRLVYAYNYVGTVYRVEAPLELPRGAGTLGCAFVKTGHLRGRVELYADGRKLAEGEIPRTLPFILSLEGLDVGEDRLTPVVDDYEVPFRFDGPLERVVVELGDDRERDPAGELEAQLRRQ